MVRKEIQDLYRDAIYHHLIRQGFHPHQAEAEAYRRMMRDDSL